MYNSDNVYANVFNDDSARVGQIIGDGITLSFRSQDNSNQTSSNNDNNADVTVGSFTLCIERRTDIELLDIDSDTDVEDLSEYDMGISDEDLETLTPMDLTDVTLKDNQLCGTVRGDQVKVGRPIFPIARYYIILHMEGGLMLRLFD